MKPADQDIHCYIVIYLVIITVLAEEIRKSTGHFRGGSRISGKGVHMYKGWGGGGGGGFALVIVHISFFCNIT